MCFGVRSDNISRGITTRAGRGTASTTAATTSFEHITITSFMPVTGDPLPVGVILSRKSLNDSMPDLWPEAKFWCSDSGSQTPETFPAMLEACCLKPLRERFPDRNDKILLVMDGGGGSWLHISVPMVLLLERYGVECFILPSHTTAALCALDQQPHQLMSLRWGTFKAQWSRSGNDLNIFQAIAALRRIVAEALSPQNALAGWARVGVQPNELMQKHVVLEERFSELFTSKKSGGGSLPAPQTSTADALSLVSQISPKKKKCGQNSCKSMVAVTMRFCPECASPNAHFDQAEADMFRSGRRKGWHKPPQPEVPQLPETPAERRLAQGVGDLLGRLRRGGAAQSEDASAKPSQTGDGVAEIQEPPCKQQKTEHKAASFSKPSTVELGPEPLEEDEDASDPEWNLNSPDDCCSFIEHYFPAKEAEALGVSIDMFSKVAKFYVNFLRTKRTPKADLCVHFAKEIIEPKTLNSKAGRKNWLQTWLTERKRVFVPKT